jgi:hypothetical protein
MNRVGDKTFARDVFAQDENGRIRWGNLFNPE